jgi:hypothetical protein
MKMTCKPLLAGVVFLMASMSTGRAAAEGPSFKAVHLFNVASGAAEADLLRALDEMNQVIAKAGHPESRYRVWKVQGDQQGSQAYLFESNWPDRAVYAKVHDDPSYKRAFERLQPAIEASMKDHVYNRYLEVPVATTKK